MQHNAQHIAPPLEELSSWSVKKLLYVFYFVIFELGRLLQTSALLWALEKKQVYNKLRKKKDKKFEEIYSESLHWTCTEPVLVMKVWADLYNLRLQVPYEDRIQKATQGILQDCMYLTDILPTLVQLIEVELAGKYMTYLLFIDHQSSTRRKKERADLDVPGPLADLDAPGPLLVTKPFAKMRIVQEMQAQRPREALAIYLRAQIDERIDLFRRNV
jgi:hypothetical protein